MVIVPCDVRADASKDGESECGVCLENRVNAILLPCNCAKLCMKCAVYRASAAHACPTCGKVATEVKYVFI